MAKPYTTNFVEKVSAVSGVAPLYLLEITHANLAVPVRVVNDTQDIVSGGNTYTALAFRISLPDDIAQQLPRARLAMDNVGRELTQWLEASSGGRGALVRVMQVMRDTPSILEFDVTLDLLNVRQNAFEVTAELGFQNVLTVPALPAVYRPDNTPALF